MAKCSFCGYDIEKGTGKSLVQKDGSMVDFCSNRCEKSQVNLKRNPLKVRWTLKHREFHGKGAGKVKEIEGQVEEKTGKKERVTPKFEEQGAKKKEEVKEEKKEEVKEEKTEEKKEEKAEEKKEEKKK